MFLLVAQATGSSLAYSCSTSHKWKTFQPVETQMKIKP